MRNGAALVLASAVPAAGNAQQAAAGSLVFDQVTVVDVEQGKLVPDQRIVITGNRIQAVGPAGQVRVPPGARLVEAQGKYLIPGLWDLHTHSQRYATDFFYPLFIANGVTGIRDASSEMPLDTLRRWRQEILAGARVGPPRQLLSAQAINGPVAGCVRKEKKNLHTCLADSVDARHLVDSFKTAGIDMIKTYNLSQKLYAVLAAEARRLGVPFGGHAPGETALAILGATALGDPDQGVTPLEASNYGASIVDHELGERDCQRLVANRPSAVTRDSLGKTFEQCEEKAAERFRRSGTWFVPTLVRLGGSLAGKRAPAVVRRFKARAEEFWTGSSLHGNWLRDSTGSTPSPARDAGSHNDSLGGMYFLHRFGVPLLAGTDASARHLEREPPGFSLHAELETYVVEGLTSLEALQAATLNPAKMVHGTDSLGTIAPGKLADLVLLEADPLADITNTTTIHAVVANGRYFDRAALDGLLSEVQAKAKQEPQPLGMAR